MLTTKKIFDIASIRQDFPILQRKMHGKQLVYLDNAATTQKPLSVINAISNYYLTQNANVHRGAYQLSDTATQAYEAARACISQFLHAKSSHEIIFTRGTTEAINLMAHSYALPQLKAGDEVIVTVLEHHSNFVPWQLVCEKTGAILRVVPLMENRALDLAAYERLLNPRTRLVAISHLSNVTGAINPVKKMIELAHANGTPVFIDGAQAVAHQPIDVQDLDCDFYTFSSHKLYGPMGCGVLYGKTHWLEKMQPYQTGGGMVSQVNLTKTSFKALPGKFEAGTPNVADAVGLSAAIEYLQQLNWEDIQMHEQALFHYAVEQLSALKNLEMISTVNNATAVISFMLKDIHPHDIATVLDSEGIAIRAGHHCAMPLMDFLKIPATARISFGLYNTKEEVDLLVLALHKVKKIFRVESNDV